MVHEGYYGFERARLEAAPTRPKKVRLSPLA
jgi:hypothetical protein